MASPEISPPPLVKPKTSRKRKKVASVSSPARVADVEAIGLVLFGLGIVALFTVFSPLLKASLRLEAFTSWHQFLFVASGWGMYFVPVPFFVFGALLLAKKKVGFAARVLLGVFIMIVAGLLGTAFFNAKAAGNLAVAVMTQVKVVTPLAFLLIAFVGSLGLELTLGWRRTRIARAAARMTSLGMLSAASATGAAAKKAKDATNRLSLQIAARRGFDAASRDIVELQDLYSGSGDLSSWKREIDRSSDAINDADEPRLIALRDEAGSFRSRVAAFTQARGKDITQNLALEDVGALLLIDESRKQLLNPVLSKNAAAIALEDVRRALQLETKALEETERKLVRERDNASRALSAALRPMDLRLELERHEARLERSKQLRVKCEHLLTRVAPLAGWHEFIARLENREEADVLAFVKNLESSLQNGMADVLPELPHWTADLDSLERNLMTQAAQAVALEQTQMVWDQLDQKNQAEVIYNATFELEYPNGQFISGEDASRVIQNGLETTDIGLEDDDAAPWQESTWVSPAERAAQKMEAARVARNTVSQEQDARVRRANGLQQNTEKQFQDNNGIAPGIADSGVGERLRFDPSKAVGAIPIQVPSTAFLDPMQVSGIDMVAFDRAARERGAILDETFKNFGVNAKVLTFARGPTVTRFEVEPAPGEKIARIASLQNDIARVLSVGGIRLEAPVPGKSVVGIEVPNIEREPITFRQGIESKSFQSGKQKLPLMLGKSIDGEMVVDDLVRMPHLLIAGSTGSGKSVCVNTLIMSLLFRYLPTQMRFVMIDPKMVELTPYDGIPHLVRPVVTNPSDAAGVLLGCVAHMERRYKMMSEVQAKNLEQYNEKARAVGDPELPYLIIIIDELADLMITSPKEVESSIMRLAQMARATGMHLVLATQRPSADVLTGLIKVNVPARIAFAVSSGIDSRTILDSTGAERLTGNGDMLFYRPGLSKATRLQGPYISEAELARITEFLRKQHYEDDFGETYGSDFDGVVEAVSTGKVDSSMIDFGDPLIKKAAEVVVEEGYAAVSRLQRRLSVGHSRGGKLIDALESMGIVGGYKGSKSREVLITADQLPEYFGKPN
jgi:DNA segregation ATPase FtsK/SpoIIIE, S-DNA-T family